MEDLNIEVKDQIIKRMDGRTQRWLSFKVLIPETELSKKLKGKLEFTDEEMDKIEEVLDFKINRECL